MIGRDRELELLRRTWEGVTTARRPREIALAKGHYAEAAQLANDAIDQSREVRRTKYELAARLVLGRALMALGQPERGIDELRAALDGIQRLGHPPTLWRAWSTLGTALAQIGQDEEAAEAAAAAAQTLRIFAATLAPERAGPLLAAEPSRDILSAAGSGYEDIEAGLTRAFSRNVASPCVHA